MTVDLPGRYPAAVAELPPGLVARLQPHASLVKARRGRTLVAFGTSSRAVYLVLSGRARVMLHSLHGREVILRDLTVGALFGELSALDEQPRSASITAVADCVLASLPGEAFRAACVETPEAAGWMVRRLVAQVRDLTDKVFELNTLRVASRLHCELLRLSVGVEGDADRAVIEPAPTHAALAARIGTHREAVTRELGYLTGRGILKAGDGRLTILDLPTLGALVQDATGTLRSALAAR